MSINRQQKKNS